MTEPAFRGLRLVHETLGNGDIALTYEERTREEEQRLPSLHYTYDYANKKAQYPVNGMKVKRPPAKGCAIVEKYQTGSESIS